jgi:hypothetical protein
LETQIAFSGTRKYYFFGLSVRYGKGLFLTHLYSVASSEVPHSTMGKGWSITTP